MNRRVTQRDIARKAGFSHVTVSLALRESPTIPETTRNKIKEIAQSLGYSPDPLLSALSAYRTAQRPAAHHANIAWLYTENFSVNKGWGDFEQYYLGAQTRARKLGYILDEINVAGDHADPRRLRRLLDARNITGLILAPCSTDPAISHDFDFDLANYSAVRIGYSYRAPLLNTVANAQFRTVLTAVRKAIDLGYERIGTILTRQLDERTSWQFLGGYLAGVHFLPRKNWIEPIYVAPNNHDWIPEFLSWVEKERIDCFIGPSYGYLCDALRERGFRVPQDVGFVDTQLPPSGAGSHFSGIHQNANQIGVAAVDLLVSMMHRHEVGVPAIMSHVLIEGSWRDGDSTMNRALNPR